MGTMLYSRGVYISRCYDEVNISNPSLVGEIHQEYIKAGADVLETNTFGANRLKLGGHGLADRVAEINESGASLACAAARAAAGNVVLVAGSVGPLGVRLAPYGQIGRKDALEIFGEQVSALVSGGVDLIIFETFSDMLELEVAVEAARKHHDLPVITSFTVADNGTTLYGAEPAEAGKFLSSLEVDGLGVNCSVGPPVMMNALEGLLEVTELPVSIMPNAGTPREVEGRNFYLASSEYMASYARKFIRAGARIVGGCCGTTPGYIKAMRNYIASFSPRKTISTRGNAGDGEATKVEPIPFGERSKLAASLAEGKFIRTVELIPPRGRDTQRILKSCGILKEHGIDAVNIPDGPRALSRMSAQLLCVIIQESVGIETFLHYTCRDRNLLGMMSDMLGLSAAGVNNILIVTGDPPKMGDYPDATAVFDVDSIGLSHLVAGLNRGVDLGGNAIGNPTGYLIGVGVNPGAIDRAREMDRYWKKIGAGAEVAVTQPVFDPRILISFCSEVETANIPIIAGIWPLVSLRNAEFMNNEIPGASVPEPTMERMRLADKNGSALEEGIRIAREAVQTIRPYVQGIQVSAPFGKTEYALEVLKGLDD